MKTHFVEDTETQENKNMSLGGMWPNLTQHWPPKQCVCVCVSTLDTNYDLGVLYTTNYYCDKRKLV